MIPAYLLLVILTVLGLWVLLRHMKRIEPERVEIVRREIVSGALPAELDGMTLCHVSDLHITEDLRNSRAVADALRSVRADLYLLTGDMIHGRKGIAALDRWLGEVGGDILPAIAVFGNAEHKPRINPNDVRTVLEGHGVRVLANQREIVELTHRSIQVIGIDDPHSRHSRVAAAYSEADSKLWTLVLIHSPEGVLELDGRRADLVLSGHTHGGQILLPGIGWISDNTHNRIGLISGFYSQADIAELAGINHGPVALYVSRGLGTSGWPLRLRCRPELPVLTLRREGVAPTNRNNRIG